MKSNKKPEIEEQITSMLEKMMIEDFEDNSSNTIDTSQEYFNGRKKIIKCISQQLNRQLIQDSYLDRIDNRVINPRPDHPKKSYTVNYINNLNPFNSFISNQSIGFPPNFGQNYYGQPNNFMRYQNGFNQPMINFNNECYIINNNSNMSELRLENENNNLSDVLYAQLEEILSSNGKITEKLFKQLKGKFVQIIRTQNGSRIFQKYLRNTSSNIISSIFCELQGSIKDLITHMYANYFCQKFFSFLDNQERVKFLEEIYFSFIEISISKIGTYPLQAVIEQIVDRNEKEIIISAVSDHVLYLSKDPQGSHVVEKIIVCYHQEQIQFIYDQIINNFMYLANHSNGLCVVKKIIIHTKKLETINMLKDLIIDNSMFLIQNPYGNYVIQVALDYWKDEHIIAIILQFNNKYTNLSIQKYSSNVVEKCLEKSQDFALNKFIDEVCNMNRIADLMKNNYGNYVVQKALKLSRNENRIKLIDSIIKNIDKIGDRKIILKWQTIINNFVNVPINNVFRNCSSKKVSKTVVYKKKSNTMDAENVNGDLFKDNFLNDR